MTDANREGRDRPILFSAPMVRAILDKRKTQTRRIVKPQDVENVDGVPYLMPYMTGVPESVELPCPYGVPGDRLWVRETHAFTADGLPAYFDDFTDEEWAARRDRKPSIFMRRAHSRITLEVTAVRVEELTDITDTDAIAEGLEPQREPSLPLGITGCWRGAKVLFTDPIDAYADLWDSINGERAPWKSNPLVWVVEFKRSTGT